MSGTGKQMEELSNKRQGPDELFQDFVSQLMTTAGSHWVVLGWTFTCKAVDLREC